MARVVETDNYDGDFPDESFLNIPRTDKETAQKLCDIINADPYSGNDRYWKVVSNEYNLRPGFEP